MAIVATACGGSHDAPAAPTGFFPKNYSAPGFVTGARLLKASAVTGATRTFRFHAVAPPPGGYAFVARCYHGHVLINEGGVVAGGPCMGTAGVHAACAGGIDRRVTVTVDRAQRAEWGIAIYRSSCQPETAAARRAKQPKHNN